MLSYFPDQKNILYAHPIRMGHFGVRAGVLNVFRWDIFLRWLLLTLFAWIEIIKLVNETCITILRIMLTTSWSKLQSNWIKNVWYIDIHPPDVYLHPHPLHQMFCSWPINFVCSCGMCIVHYSWWAPHTFFFQMSSAFLLLSYSCVIYQSWDDCEPRYVFILTVLEV